MRHLFSLLLVIIAIGAVNLRAQTKSIQIPGAKGNIFSHHIAGDYVYFFTGAENSYEGCNLHRMNLNNKQTEILDTNIAYGQSMRFTESGVFYISFRYLPNGNDGEHTLHYRSYNNSVKWSKVVNQYTNGHRPSNALVHKEKYYAVVRTNNQYKLMISDGSESGTINYYPTNNPIEFLILNDKPYIYHLEGNRYVLKDLSGNIKIKQFSYVSYSDNQFLMFVKNNRLSFTNDMENFDSSTYSKIPMNKIEVVYINDSLLTCVHTDIWNKVQTFKIRKKTPFSFDSIAPALSIREKGSYITYKAEKGKNQYRIYWSFKTGFEMMYIPESDSIKLLSDYNKGYPSSVFPNYPITNHIEDGILYYWASNGGDYKKYLLSTDGHKIKCHFPIPHLSPFSARFISDSVYYWSDYNNDGLFVFYRHLNDRDTQVNKGPDKPSHSLTDEWHRSVASLNTEYPSSYYNSNTVTCNGLEIGPDGNPIVFGQTRDNSNEMMIRYSDTGIADELKGDLILVKYDKVGRILWSGTYGNTGRDVFWMRNAFTLDSKGDIILFGCYNQFANFDHINFSVGRNAMFCTKISGETGKTIWAKSFNESNYSNDFSADGVVCDKDNNIYLSLYYKNFRGEFGPITLQSDKSPVNAILKMNPDGDFIWGTNTPTVWMDRYGQSRSLSYDPQQNVIYDLISQGYYNWMASCKNSPFRSVIHKIDNKGRILESFNFSGDDLNSATVAIPTKSSRLFVSGFYRNKYNLGPLSVESSKGSSPNYCNIYENFNGTLSSYNLKPSGLRSSDGISFFPFDICKDENYLYVIGAEKNPLLPPYNAEMLCIRKYSHLGKLLAKRFLNGRAYDPFDFNFSQSIAVAGDFIYIGTSTKHAIEPYDNFVDNNPGVSLYKLYKNDDWIEVGHYESEQTESGIVIGPNPTSDYLNLHFFHPGDYDRLDLYDMSGKKVLSKSLSKDNYILLDLTAISSGNYILHFNGVKVYSQLLVVE